MVKVACVYSKSCNPVKRIARRIVTHKPKMVCFLDPANNAWCAHVALAPDKSKMTVFNKGISKGEKTSIPCGGQTVPSSMVGANAEWKKAQKKPKKNITSDTTNKINPNFNPSCTAKVCCPSNVASTITSLHHPVADIATRKKPTSNNIDPLWNEWNQSTAPKAIRKSDQEAKNAQGLGSTTW